MESEPLVSIVTPSFNSEKFIRETINSVINQSYDNIEHIIVDGASTDETLDIIKEFENKYSLKWISEPDNGMYDAIEKGFKMASGDIYSWLNSDDMYLPWAVDVAVNHLSQDGINWITGHPARWDEDGVMYYVKPLQPHYCQRWIKNGWYHGEALGWMQQESMFWTSELWDTKGGFPDGVNLAGDYYLWKNFAEKSDIKQVGTVLAGFRRHDDQMSLDLEEYFSELPNTGLLPKIMGIMQMHGIYSLALNFTDYVKWRNTRR